MNIQRVVIGILVLLVIGILVMFRTPARMPETSNAPQPKIYQNLPRDRIPSIDAPKFVTASEASTWLKDAQYGLAFSHKGIDRFYSFSILNWHEIVNDTFGTDPVLITYCPLCATGIVFERKVRGETVEFGTSGALYNSDLVMYDRKTKSLWSQISAEAISGELTGDKLTMLSADNISFGVWKKEHPTGEVLSRDTGFSRDYDVDPYGGYERSRVLFSPVDFQDDRLHPKALVYGIELNGKFKAYQEEALTKAGGRVDDTFAGETLIVVHDATSRTTRVSKKGTQERVPGIQAFWFAWFAFHPETELYR